MDAVLDARVVDAVGLTRPENDLDGIRVRVDHRTTGHRTTSLALAEFSKAVVVPL
jgi:hypothetical protein